MKSKLGFVFWILYFVFIQRSFAEEIRSESVKSQSDFNVGILPQNNESALLFDEQDDLSVGSCRIEPIGFSRNGQFAYARYTSDGFCGDCSDFQILDLVTDKSTSIGGIDGEHKELNELDGELKEKLFSALKEKHINQNQNLVLEDFPYETSDDRFETSITREQRNDLKESQCEGNWAIVRLVLTSKKLGQKEISKLSRCDDPSSHDDNMDKILGFYRSPYEKRIVILTSGRRYVLEGDYEDQVMLFGAHLGVGFKK